MSNSNSTFDVGKNIAQLREEHGYSLEQLVSAMKTLGYSWNRTTLFNIEHGLRRLQFQEAYDLLDCMGLDPIKDMYLLCRKDSPSLGELAHQKREQYAEKLRRAWNEYLEACALYDKAMQYDEKHQYTEPKWIDHSRQHFSWVDSSFRELVDNNQPDSATGSVYLHDFPVPPADKSPHNEPST